MKKTNVVCNNQNSLERATIELKKVNRSIIKYPLFFSFSENTVGQNKSHQFILFCVIFPSCQTLLFCINCFYLSDTVHKQHIYFFISQQLPRFLPTGKRHRFINRPWIKYIVRVEKILGITGFKSIPVVYYSLICNDFHNHKSYFQCVFYLDSKMKVEIDWLSDL